MDEQALKNALKDLALPQVHYFDETDSTNERALEFAAQGTPEFTLVITDRQTAGRGRFSRRWETTPGTSLAFTLILHPTPEEQKRLGLFSFLGAIAICLAIESICQAKPQVKWPNDVLLGGQKTSGVLAETAWHGQYLNGLVLGMGINLLPGSVPPADRVIFPATCVQAHCDKQIDRLEFLASTLGYLTLWRFRLLTEEFLEAYRSRLSFVGQRVILTPIEGNSVTGKLIGIDQFGQVILKLDGGNEIAYPIGDLKLRVAL